ncbi:MAG TPA: CAAX prenyl protease-related protein [Verrucomicrobiales bacterium]|nr:CAAX prenyl protease-related protein [Pedosphaera sp.]RZO68323.1 MAG: CAAX prenyl protease-related protein [Limisphaerales bacterium]HAO68293.1 CAAX prenyl protease-related protein [Verrucomicrobiales bacterium]HAR00157.1 CAAX prenyl protease-related protein [Verrucomicrobiales bacterium]HAW02520.1 CAAX prenyl protease-related protein [Verrucomicrobiales bacterium]|tara:strand:+ start:348 stop:1043 length:696 start_codon:yes stop_codon:yes gene_type:complete
MSQPSLYQKLVNSPMGVRMAPFILFLILTSGQGQFGDSSAFWLYLIKSVVGIGLIAWMWPRVKEMRWHFSWEAIAVGILVYVLWVGLDPYFPHLSDFGGGDKEDAFVWNPHALFGQGTALAWLFIVVRILGMTVVVPPLEEVFYRSTIYRYIVQPHFDKIPLGQMHWGAFLGTSALFGLAHNEWLSGILCGLLYQCLVIRKNRLGDAITAHAITNFLLGIHVATRGAWQFW